ncbi:MAG TPA: PAS domain-containing protein, partial [Cyanobacteria bacterium UBA11148]|nr:PAS domain-containing protein [Cyanobacteria bacterium UBA11148]
SGYPLIVDSRLVGVIALHSHQPFSKVVNGVLGWVANAIAVAIDRVWAREELLSRREALLFQLASQIRNSLELDTILDTAVTEIKSLLDLDGCHFLWYIPEPNPPSLSVTHEARNSNLPSLLGECPLPEFAPLAKTITNLQPLRIADLAKAGNLDSETRSLLVHWGITSGLVLPLKTQTGQLGAIVCSYCEGSRQWSDREVELLQAVVDQLAIAIEHAELFAKTRASALAAQTQAHQLEQALNELRQTQALLIQTDKMSTIGQMVAGIAHEINNPVNFITGNLSHATNYIEDLIELINRYQHHYRNPVPEIQDYIEDIELPFLIEDLPKMLASMQMGADRIQEIVVSLRNFSRQDQAEMRSVNIHEGIDSTLLILRNRMKPYGNRPGITVIKEYGNLPLVECYAGQLNQVFMNIISNAIDALEMEREGQLNPEPMIWIHTDILDNHDVVIRIRDNGSGMTPSVVERLFEPFFTTKPVGKGTGLGLSISHQIIVEKHGGILNCHSEGGQGTEFWIQIPLKQNSNHPL